MRLFGASLYFPGMAPLYAIMYLLPPAIVVGPATFSKLNPKLFFVSILVPLSSFQDRPSDDVALFMTPAFWKYILQVPSGSLTTSGNTVNVLRTPLSGSHLIPSDDVAE